MTHPFGLDGKRVIVVGASRGIGAASAAACARVGAEVVLLARSRENLERVAGVITRSGGLASTVTCDVTSVVSIREAFEQVGQLDVLVNSAGVNVPQLFEDVQEKTFDHLFAVNVRGAFFAAQAAIQRMSRQGTIVMISSQMGHVGAPLRTVYCATKHALEGLTKALALEAAPRGIRVVSIAPTFVRTDLTSTQLDDLEIGPQLLDQIPLGRFGSVDEVADAVVYAASPAARMMTGSSLMLDGGWTAK